MGTLVPFMMFFSFVMFHHVISAQNDCGNTSFSESEGVITSPEFPLSNPQNLSCRYSIDVGRNNSVLLKFLEFDLESPLYADTSCIHDFLTITCNETDDENLDFRKRSCGMDPPKTSLWFSNCPVVQLNFFADSSVTGGGFSIEYNVIETANLADNISEIDCGDSMFTSSSEFIRLPSNPTEYSAKVDCNYTISTNNASTFSLGVLSLHLPQLLDSLADCDIDYITIGCVSIEATELNPNTSKTYCRRSFDNIPVQPSRIVFSNCSMVKISIRSSDYNYQGHSSIPFTVSAYDEDCGITVFSGSTGLINSPRFPLSYPHSLDCIYFFDVDITTTVTLDSILFNLEGYSRAPVEDYCLYTWLKISCLSDCGSASANPNQNRKYCGQKVKPLQLSYSNCDCLTLNFVTNSSATTQGFQFRYEMTSPGNETASTPDKDRRNISVTDPTGFITSPHYPLTYPHKIDYIYSFNVNRTQTVGLYFYSFNVEGTSHSLYIDTCHYDWLEIACKPGVWRYSRNSRYCGEKTTPLILSYSNCDSLTLNFVSDSSITSGGFKIWYSVSSAGQTDCRETSFTDRNGVLVSPNFPLSYPINMNCTYAIDVGRNNSVQLKFKYFELQAPRSTGYCANDWLTITCNETTKVNPNYGKKYCGSIQWSSSLRFVDCPSLVMEFVSDSSLYSHGFMLEYTVTEKSNTSEDNSELDCGDTLFTESSGNISLPGNPTGYLATVNCTYTISTNRTDVIWLNAYFQTTMKFLQSFQNCEGESVMIGCVAGEEAEFNRSSAKVFCRGGIFSPSSSGNLLVFSDCRTLKLSIRSTNYDNQETFSIPFSVLGQDEVCGNMSSLSSPTGVVSTLRVPYRYPKRVNCQYTIDSGQINSVIISVDRLNFQYAYYMDSSCNFGWLTITCLVNGTSMANRKLCGLRYSIKARFPECQEVLLNLTSDYISSDSGLTLRYRVGDYELDCGTTLFTNSSGVISLPINPTGYPASVNCTYTVSANYSSYIYLNSYLSSSTQFLNSFQDCSTEWLKVGCVSDEDAELNPLTTKTYCQQQNPSYGYYRYPMLYADCRTLKLSIRSRTYDLREGFRIAFLAVGPDNICGKTSFSDLTGTVSSPHLPFRYSKRVSCVYTIDSGEVNSFTLSIDRLSFGDEYGRQRGCDSGWLTITCLMNGTAIAHPLAGRKLCGLPHGYDKMTGRFHACRSVLLNFTSGSVSSSSSFNVRYRIGDYELDCGTTLFNFAGVLSLPNSPTNFPATVNCTYTISTNRTSDISLNIHYYSLREFLKSFQDCDRDNVTIACIPEEETDLNRVRTRILCYRDISSISYADTRLVFTDCFTLKLVIRSATYDYRQMQRVPFSVNAADEICGNTSFSAETGRISSPTLPSRYPKRINCVYVIDSGHINSVVLSLDRLNIGSSSAYNHDGPCYKDWLTISCLVNGTSKAHPNADRKLCGSQSPFIARFPACRSVVLNFSSEYALDSTGFTIRYRMGDNELDCGTTLFSNSSGGISVPNNPTNFPATVNCTYTISTNRTSDIWINIDNYWLREFLKSFQDCDRDNLTIVCIPEEETDLNRVRTRVLCSRDISSISYSDTRLVFVDCFTLKLSIRSGIYDHRQMLRFPFSVFAGDEICGNTSFSAQTGRISSPTLPSRYPKRINCVYVIDSGHIDSVVLSLDRLNIGSPSVYTNNGPCYKDWLTITCLVNGTSMDRPDRNLCGSQNPFIARFPACRSVLLNFSSDYAIDYTGFTIRYRIGDYELDCGPTQLSNSSGVISLPNNPTNFPATVNCTYTISKNRTSDIWLDVHYYWLREFLKSFQDCDRNNVTIVCIPEEEEADLNRLRTRVYCSQDISSISYSDNRLVFVDCFTLKLYIRSDIYDYRQISRVPVSVLAGDEICGNTSYSAQTGVISSPTLSSRYPKRINCVYVIDSGHINSVVLRIERLNIGSSSVYNVNEPCYNDWLTITCLVNGTSMDHPTADRKLCGSQSPFIARFPACRSVLLNFSSDYALDYTGFTIRYRIGDYDPECGNTSFSGPSGVITSPQFPLSYAHNLNCLYSITGGQQNSIFLSVLLLSLEGTSNTLSIDICAHDWLTVSCLSDDAVVSMANLSSSRRYCGVKTAPLTFEFPSCAAVVLNFRSDSSVTGGGFLVRYTVKNADLICGSPIYGRPSGVINVPWNYTDYDGSLDCSYVINATEPSSISLTIWSISLQSLFGGSCQRDWLLVTCIDGQRTMNLNVTHTSCDNISSSIQLTFPDCTATQLGFHRDVDTVGRTFRIEYAVVGYGGNVNATEFLTTSIAAAQPLGTAKSCATGCKLSSDSTNCDCLPNTSKTPTVSVSRENPITRSTNCAVGCKLNADGNTCDCSTTHSGDNAPSTKLPTASISAAQPAGTQTSCPTGCKLSSDSTNYDCPPDKSQTAAISVSKEIPITRSANCEVGCEMNTDRTTCDCPTTHSGDLVVITQMNLSSQRGHAVGISLAVILVITGAICLGAFLLFRRHQKKNRSEALLQASEEDRAQMELEADSTKSGSLFGIQRRQDRDTSRYLPLRPVSTIDHEELSTISNKTEIHDEIKPGL